VNNNSKTPHPPFTPFEEIRMEGELKTEKRLFFYSWFWCLLIDYSSRSQIMWHIVKLRLYAYECYYFTSGCEISVFEKDSSNSIDFFPHGLSYNRGAA
jgi:hypothetical protein